MQRTGRRPVGAPVPAFQAFLEDNREIVYRFLVASAGPGDADDLFQDTFLAALRAYPRLGHGGNLRSWVLTIATRKVIDAARSAKRRPVAVADVESFEGVTDAIDGAEGWRPDPKEPIWGAVLALPAKQRAAVVHRFVLDRSYREIGAALECSEDAARANVSEAVRKLRERWNHAGAFRR
jgi:RNA polymerase sigma factor (sigma-70 family)